MGKNKQLHSVLARSDMNRSWAERGFTLVELLVVIVVIAILASIAVISYRGIQGQTAETVLQSDLRSAGNQLKNGMTHYGTYVSSESELAKSPGTEYEYNSTNDSYCLTATSSKSSKAFYISSDTRAVKEGTCPGHSGPGSGSDSSGTIANGDPIQDLTRSQCDSMTAYDGSNPGVILTLKDSRGGTDRNYEVAKLADGNCWMLSNLKLGSENGPITLTPVDSDVAINFILPKLYSGSSLSENHHDDPKAYGPVLGDTDSGATSYGYLYNWSAATAGESRASYSQSGGGAPNSICPRNWKLPTGGHTAGVGDFSRLDQAFGGSGQYHNGGSASSWSYDGPFKGTLSGKWWGGFSGQGGFGYLWSSSANLTRDFALYSYFSPNLVAPGDFDDDRTFGHGVRCLLR